MWRCGQAIGTSSISVRPRVDWFRTRIEINYLRNLKCRLPCTKGQVMEEHRQAGTTSQLSLLHLSLILKIRSREILSYPEKLSLMN
jgi:hypothetical protein